MSVVSKMASSGDEAVEPSTSEAPMTKLSIIKNLAIVSVCFLLTFTAFFGSRNLQSSLHSEGNIGINSLVIISLTAILSNLFLATLTVYKLGLKWSLLAALLTYVALPASNFSAVWYSMYVGAIVVGIGMGPLWYAKSIYLSQLGEKYAQLNGDTPEVDISFFFGIFFMMYRGSMFIGNIISSIVFRRPPSAHPTSDNNDVIVRSLCGAHYCYEDLDVAFASSVSVNATATKNVEAIYHSTTFQIDLLFAIYVAFAFLAVPLAALLDPISTSGGRKSVKIVDALLSAVTHMKNRKEIPLMPLALLSGINHAFISADYCIAFITCSIGIDNVGYVTSVYGLTSGLGSFVFGYSLKYVGRKAIFALCALCNAASIVGMLMWPPGSHSLVVLCVIAGLWGIAQAVLTSQVVLRVHSVTVDSVSIALIAIVFRDGDKDAGFTCNYVWQTGGVCMWHLASTHMCVNVQLYILAAVLTISMAGYTALEVMLKAEGAEQADNELRTNKTAQPVVSGEKSVHLSEVETSENNDFSSTRVHAK